MKNKLKTLKKTIFFILMSLILITAMLICYLLSFFDEEAYEEAWETLTKD